MIREAIENKDPRYSKEIIECIKSCGALALATEKAKAISKKAGDALENLPESQYKDALIKLAGFAIDRSY